MLDEKARLAELRSLDILDTPTDKYFDRYTKLIAEIFTAPMVIVSLIDENRQWFKSSVGMEVSETRLEEAFCVHALDKDMLEVPDTLEDELFRDHPLVVGSPCIRFYMGVTLRGPTGQPLGCLAIMDTQSRCLSGEQRAWLVTFGLLVQELINYNHDALSEAEEQHTEVSHRDGVTDLPDEGLFRNSLKHLIRVAQENKKHLAVLHLYVKKIDEIRQVYGRAARDALLRCLADRLIDDDTRVLAAGQLSQDRLAAVIRLPSLYDLFNVITPIANKLTSAIELEETTIRPDIDIGISLSPLDGRTSETLLERARTALDGPRSHAGLYVFSHEVEETALKRHTIAQHLESALHDNQLEKHYQPLVSVDGSRIVAFEALARWSDPELGNVSPADFVPIAEQDPRFWSMASSASPMASDWRSLPKGSSTKSSAPCCRSLGAMWYRGTCSVNPCSPMTPSRYSVTGRKRPEIRQPVKLARFIQIRCPKGNCHGRKQNQFHSGLPGAHQGEPPGH